MPLSFSKFHKKLRDRLKHEKPKKYLELLKTSLEASKKLDLSLGKWEEKYKKLEKEFQKHSNQCLNMF